MSREASYEISARSLLQRSKELPRQPGALRARVLARARAAAASPLPPVRVVAAQPLLSPSLVMPAAAAAVAVGVVAGAFALRGRSHLHPPARAPSPAALSREVPASPSVVSSSAAEPPDVPVAPAAPEPQAAGRARQGALVGQHAATPESYNAELELMRSAHQAYAVRDFSAAIDAIDAHARRFPSGLLSEEREALRVRCLLGAGRTSQARAAAAAFATQFPRSVLLHRLHAEVAADAE